MGQRIRQLDCTEALQTALIHIEQNGLNNAMTCLRSFEGCNETHETCEFKGDDCAVQDLILGFFYSNTESLKETA